MKRLFPIAGAVMLAVIVVSASTFVVDQRQIAVVKTFGEVREVLNANPNVNQAGLGFNWPLAQTVTLLDKRIQTLESPDAHVVFTSDKNNLLVDWLVRWRIVDPRRYLLGNGSSGDARNLSAHLAPVVQAAFSEELARHTVRGILAEDRDQILRDVQARLVDPARSLGIEIVDLRIKRADFVADVTDVIYRRMIAERKQVASQLGGEGEVEKERIRAEAEAQRATLLADATLDAQKIKGAADAQATALYADAFGRDPEFAAFYRSLEAYRTTFHSKADVLVVDTSSEFFKAMRGAEGGDAAPAARKH